MKFEIFPDFYGVDNKNWLSLNCEMCCRATELDFKSLLGAQPMAIMKAIRMINTVRARLNKDLDAVVDTLIGSDDKIILANVLHAIASPKTMAAKALRSLAEFYDEHSEEDLITYDLEDIKNWGLTIRDSQKTLVIIDAGFSK